MESGESPGVWRMSAVTLGRMKAEAALPTLRKFWTGKLSNDPTSNACGWAIHQITGEPIPPGEAVRQVRIDWFLVPIPKPHYWRSDEAQDGQRVRPRRALGTPLDPAGADVL